LSSLPAWAGSMLVPGSLVPALLPPRDRRSAEKNGSHTEGTEDTEELQEEGWMLILIRRSKLLRSPPPCLRVRHSFGKDVPLTNGYEVDGRTDCECEWFFWENDDGRNAEVALAILDKYIPTQQGKRALRNDVLNSLERGSCGADATCLRGSNGFGRMRAQSEPNTQRMLIPSRTKRGGPSVSRPAAYPSAAIAGVPIALGFTIAGFGAARKRDDIEGTMILARMYARLSADGIALRVYGILTQIDPASVYSPPPIV
jgi:hypothetical protein